MDLLLNMSNPRKRRKSLESTNEPSADGKRMAQLKPSEPLLDKEGTTSNLIPLDLATTGKLSSMPESVVAVNKATSTDKLQRSVTFTPKAKLSQKLGADSTSSERKCWPYWNKSCPEMSAWLSLPTKTDWQDSDLTCFNGSVSKTNVNSWFSMKQLSVQSEKSLRTSSPSSTASVPESPDFVSTKLR